MNFSKLSIACLLFFFIHYSANAQFLRTKGTQIVNEQNEPVILRGMGLGGWMLQEGYMFHVSNLGQQYRIREKIVDVVGEEKTAEFYNRWLSYHTTKKDIDSLAAWGFNSIRLPMHYNLYTLPVSKEPVKGKQTWLKTGFELTDSLLSWCKANKIYLILDLHAAPGGQGNDLPISDRNPKEPSLWESKANRDKTVALWKKLAERYRNEPWIGGYDIINEPNWGFEDPKKDFRGIAENKNAPLKELLINITNAIRSVDQKHIIIIEGNGFGNNYRGVLPPWDKNMVLSFHKYGNFNNEASISYFLKLRDQYKIPLWLGESGENSNTWFTEAIGLVEGKQIGWAWWQLKKMGCNNPLEIKQPEGYDKLLSYWKGEGTKPSAAEAWTILQQLLENLKIENNIYHPDVVDAMIRQVQQTTTKPFKQHLITGASTIVLAVDYDMGRQRYAYYDTDSSRYQYTPGVETDGNRGHIYRNDGVDIGYSEEQYFVSHTVAGEWMQYTINVAEEGNYMVALDLRAEKEGGVVTVTVDGSSTDELIVPPLTRWQIIPFAKPVHLKKGEQVMRLNVVKGGFHLRSVGFVRVR